MEMKFKPVLHHFGQGAVEISFGDSPMAQQSVKVCSPWILEPCRPREAQVLSSVCCLFTQYLCIAAKIFSSCLAGEWTAV